MQHHRDQDLLAAYAAGDQEAFATLMARHQELVRSACRRQTAPGDWDDCAQAVFLVLARRVDSARRAPALEAWLLRTASYVCRASRRAQLRRQRAERAVQPERPAGQPSAAVEMLDECLLRLPERQRVAVSLHYLAGRSPDDIARDLGLTRNNINKLLYRGLEALRALFRTVDVRHQSMASPGCSPAKPRPGPHPPSPWAPRPRPTSSSSPKEPPWP